MKVRDKLFIAMVSLIVLMGGAFFAISQGYLENLFRQYATAAEQANAQQLAQYLAYYYRQNGNSWIGVSDYMTNIMAQSSDYNLMLRDANGNPLVQLRRQAADGPLDQTTVPINMYGQKVASLTVSNRIMRGSPVERDVLSSMTKATVWGTIVTSMVALLVGAWLVRLMTKPLRLMAKTMRQIQSGDLEARVDISSHDEFGEVGRTFNDMTDRLHRTEEARRHLVADVAHELRTPLTIMRGQLELIQQGVKPAEPSTLLPIQDEVARLSRLVQDLHQLSLAEVGKLPLVKAPTDIEALLRRIVDNFTVEAEDSEIQLVLEEEVREPITVALDPTRITQVFVNLIGNALRYTPAGGTVRVHISRDVKHVQVAVADTGSGIAQEHLPHLFDRFYRAAGDRSRESGGTGLGLAIAKEFVEAHNGVILVESTLGEGTTFTVCLPLLGEGTTPTDAGEKATG